MCLRRGVWGGERTGLLQEGRLRLGWGSQGAVFPRPGGPPLWGTLFQLAFFCRCHSVKLPVAAGAQSPEVELGCRLGPPRCDWTACSLGPAGAVVTRTGLGLRALRGGNAASLRPSADGGWPPGGQVWTPELDGHRQGVSRTSGRSPGSRTQQGCLRHRRPLPGGAGEWIFCLLHKEALQPWERPGSHCPADLEPSP